MPKDIMVFNVYMTPCFDVGICWHIRTNIPTDGQILILFIDTNEAVVKFCC